MEKQRFVWHKIALDGGHRVLTLLFMQIHLATKFADLQDRINNAFFSVIVEQEQGKALRPEILDGLRNEAARLSADFDLLGLKLAKASTDRFQKRKQATYEEAWQFAEDVVSRFHDELDSIYFIYVSASKVRFYDNSKSFGQTVFDRFPSAEYDIREAGNCFALDCYTATVVHSMRVLEVGLNALGHALKARRSTRGWGTDLNIFSTAWQSHLKAHPKTRGWKRSFFPQLFLEFRYFADAWRNRAFHNPHARYGEEEATRVFEHVRDFMVLLATRLSERKRQI